MPRRSATGACPYELPPAARRSTLPHSSNPAGGKPEESEKFKLRRARIVRLEQEQMLEDEIAVRIIQVYTVFFYSSDVDSHFVSILLGPPFVRNHAV